MGFKHKAQSMGVDFVDAEAIRFEFELSENIVIQGVPEGEYNRTNNVIVKLKDGTAKRITFATAIIAAGAWSGEIAEKLNIGKGEGILSVGLPVEPRFVALVEYHENAAVRLTSNYFSHFSQKTLCVHNQITK